MNPKIVQKSRSTINVKHFREVSDYFREVSDYIREVSEEFREVSAIFREVSENFGKLVHIVAWKLVSRTSKQVSRNLWPCGNRGFRMIRVSFSKLGSTPTPWSDPFRDHGPNPPLSAGNPMNQGFSVSGAPFFGFGLADHAPKG